MKTLKIYLAGAMSGLTYEQMNEWRKSIKKRMLFLSDIYSCPTIIINPVSYYNFRTPRHQNEREVMQYDLTHVRTSNIIVVNLSGLNNSIGSCIELYEAYKNDIPVISFGSQEDYEKLHPWIKECITRNEKTIEGVENYIGDFYMN